MSRTKFSKHFRDSLKVLEIIFRIRAMFLWFQNCCTTFLKLFIDEKRKLFCFYKKRRGYQRLFKGWKGGPWLLHESQKKFWDLQSKIGSVRLFTMFWRLVWYHSRGHTTKIDFGKRPRLKKEQKPLRECPFEIIGFTCWPKFLSENIAQNVL